MSDRLIFETTYNMSTGDPSGIVEYAEVVFDEGTYKTSLSFRGFGDPFNGEYPDKVRVTAFDDSGVQVNCELIRVSQDKIVIPDGAPPLYAVWTDTGEFSLTDTDANALSIGGSQVRFNFYSAWGGYPRNPLEIPIALYAVIDPMKKLSRNYNDKDAIVVKNPIADALDRLNAAVKGSSSGGSGTVKTATIRVTPGADDINSNFLVPVFDSYYNAYIAIDPVRGISGSEPVEVPDVAVPWVISGELVKTITGEYEAFSESMFLIAGDCEIELEATLG